MILVRKPLGRPGRMWEDNIKMSLGGMVCEDGNCLELSQNRAQLQVLVLAVLNLRILLTEDWLVREITWGWEGGGIG
jgi:hypothetical protein